jgi:hypothetical protein
MAAQLHPLLTPISVSLDAKIGFHPLQLLAAASQFNFLMSPQDPQRWHSFEGSVA